MQKSFRSYCCLPALFLLLSGCVVHESPGHHRVHRQVAIPAPGVTLVSMPGNASVRVFAGQNYYIHDGFFYRTHGKAYIRVAPPVGLSLEVLPSGFVKIKRNGRWYYHRDGVYLRWDAKLKLYLVTEL